MANVLYTNGKNLILSGGLDWATANLKAVLVSSGYTPNLATDQFLSAIASGDRLSGKVALSGLSVSNGAAFASAITFNGVPDADVGTQIVIFVDTGTDSTSPLVAYFNVGQGLPVISDAGAIVCTFFSNQVFSI